MELAGHARDSFRPIRVGILDSSFNPPTDAHLALLTQTVLSLQLDCYLLLISSVNADKGEVKAALAPADGKSKFFSDHGPDGGLHGRLEMMKLLAFEAKTKLNSALSITDHLIVAEGLLLMLTDYV